MRKKASVILTTNLEFSRLSELFENEIMVVAFIDRITYRSHILNMNVTASYRLEQTLSTPAQDKDRAEKKRAREM